MRMGVVLAVVLLVGFVLPIVGAEPVFSKSFTVVVDKTPPSVDADINLAPFSSKLTNYFLYISPKIGETESPVKAGFKMFLTDGGWVGCTTDRTADYRSDSLTATSLCTSGSNCAQRIPVYGDIAEKAYPIELTNMDRPYITICLYADSPLFSEENTQKQIIFTNPASCVYKLEINVNKDDTCQWTLGDSSGCNHIKFGVVDKFGRPIDNVVGIEGIVKVDTDHGVDGWDNPVTYVYHAKLVNSTGQEKNLIKAILNMDDDDEKHVYFTLNAPYQIKYFRAIKAIDISHEDHHLRRAHAKLHLINETFAKCGEKTKISCEKDNKCGEGGLSSANWGWAFTQRDCEKYAQKQNKGPFWVFDPVALRCTLYDNITSTCSEYDQVDYPFRGKIIGFAYNEFLGKCNGRPCFERLDKEICLKRAGQIDSGHPWHY